MRVNYVLGSGVPPASGYGKYSLTVLSELRKLGLTVREITINSPQSKYAQTLLNFSATPAKVLLHSRGAVTHASSQGLAFVGLMGVKPFVVTAYDAIPLALPEENRSFLKKGLLSLMKHGLRRADAIITISEFSKAELAKHAGLDPKRIFVAYPGVDLKVFKPKAGIKPRLDTVLYVGSEQPRKNTATLLKAFALAKKQLPKLRLVKVGAPQWKTGRHDFLAKAKELGVEKSIKFVDGLSEAQLAQEYRAAGVLVFPSTYEGFGLPPLEAMACGTPVACSNAASLPEVTGDAAISLNSHDTKGFANAIVTLLTNNKLRAKFRSRGLKQAKKFSWKEAAVQTARVYSRVIHGRLKN